MNFLVNLAMKCLGLQSAVDALDGATSKAYIGGVGMIFGGIATIMTGLAGLASELIPLQGAAAYLSFAQGLGHDASAGLVVAGYLAITQGLAAIGNRHATAVLSNAVAASPTVVNVAPAPAAAPTPAAPAV